jgi:hypothetical protein
MHARYVASFLAAGALLAGCSTAPLSYLEAGPLTRTDPKLYPLRIISVDGDYSRQHSRPVAPGPHSIIVAPPPLPGTRRIDERPFMLRVEPCTRYYLAARRESPVIHEWQLVVDATEPVAGCDAEEERRKLSQPQ